MAGYCKELARTEITSNSGPTAVELSWSLPGGCTSLWIEANYAVAGTASNKMRMKWNGAWLGGNNAAAKDSYLIQQIEEYSHDMFRGQHNDLNTGANGNRNEYGFQIECSPNNYFWYDTTNSNEPWPTQGLLGYVLSPATTDNMKMPMFQYWNVSSSNNITIDASYSWSQRWGSGVIDPYAHDAVTKAKFSSIRFECGDSTERFANKSTFAVHAYGA
tara:strand:+ start:1996 stop:2646 length:651 start_codon:yes stop_codon:yes gene_type:complete